MDKGELEPGINIIKKILVNWLRQIEGGIHYHTAEYWEDFNTQTGGVRGPVNYYRRTIQKLGWQDNTPTNITDHNGQTRNLNEWHEFVHDGIKRAR